MFHVNCLPADNSHGISRLIDFLTEVTKYTSAAFLCEGLRVDKRITFLHFRLHRTILYQLLSVTPNIN